MPPDLAADLAAILERDLATLRREVEAFPDDNLLWTVVPGMPNCAGTLVLHLAGNIQHYWGARLGDSGYVRDRDAEFARRAVPRSELLAEIERARRAVQAGARRLDEERLRSDFPEPVANARVRTSEYLVHLCAHFAYHLGQLDAQRRLVTGQAEAVGAMSPAQLRSARPAAGG